MGNDVMNKKNGFTLMEMLVGLAIATIAIGGMFAATMSYMRIWQSTSDSQLKEQFDTEMALMRFMINEISMVINGLSQPKSSEKITFRKLTGEQVIPGTSNSEVAFYWQTLNHLPFVANNNGGITECWLKFEGDQSELKSAVSSELRLYYRSLAPGDKPKGLHGEEGTGKWSDPLQHVILLNNCNGVKYGYSEDAASSPKVTFTDGLKFKDGVNPDLPEFIQILVGEREEKRS
jgi:prepilin-type N-terminal cleavage/methylation domain-containing protein